jgi:GNAT superfamily N-acetyltransferase
MTQEIAGGEPLKARITHLEMLAPPPHRVAMPIGCRLAVMRAREMPLPFYRYLYEQVGKAHHWLLRRDTPDQELATLIHSEKTEIQVLYVEGSPAGFFELDLSGLSDEAEILYFGITPDFQGRGLARFFLSEAIFAAWAQQPGRLVIHTNTLDNPRALQLYQRAGFSPYAYSEEVVVPWV